MYGIEGETYVCERQIVCMCESMFVYINIFIANICERHRSYVCARETVCTARLQRCAVSLLGKTLYVWALCQKEPCESAERAIYE